MKRDFKEAVKHRHSNYAITNKSPVSDKEIEDIVAFAMMNVPSPFNSQSTRTVLLFGDQHKKLWDIVKDTLKAQISEAAFEKTKAKIDENFACGYATVLFFEDEDIVKNFQEKFASYKDKFPQWSEHTSAMHQFAIWTMLEDVGFGASLQHYNPVIDEEVIKTWSLPKSWKLIAQMPFGLSKEEPQAKKKLPIEEQMKVFK